MIADELRQAILVLEDQGRPLREIARALKVSRNTVRRVLRERQPLSTRELKRLYEQYRQATKVQRQRLVENPALFLRAVQNRERESADKHLAAGPEGAWSKDLTVVGAILKRLLGKVPTLFAVQQDPLERERLYQAFTPTQTQFQRLEQALAEVPGHDRR